MYSGPYASHLVAIPVGGIDLSNVGVIHGLSFAEVDLAKEAWVAVKELKLSYYIGETLLFTIHTHYGNLI